MKVTPLEIRQKQFEKKTFGGIDKDEVQAFLNSLSLAWEKSLDDQANLKARLEASEKEVIKLREVESSLYKTLKTAEETGIKSIDQAKQQALLIVQEARLKADTLHQEAKWKASKAMEIAEDYSRKSYEKMVQDIKILERDLRAIENLKDNFLSDIKIIAQDLLEKAEKANQRSANIHFNVPPPPQLDLERPTMETKSVEDVIEKLEIPENQQSIGFEQETAPAPEMKSAENPPPDSNKKEQSSAETPAKEIKEGASFFDQI
jgi:cell division initiation protein